MYADNVNFGGFCIVCALKELITDPATDQDESGAIPGGYSHTLPIRVCAAQRGRDFEAPDLEQGIYFRGVF